MCVCVCVCVCVCACACAEVTEVYDTMSCLALVSDRTATEWNKYFELKKLVGRRDAPELELLANNFPVYVQ